MTRSKDGAADEIMTETSSARRKPGRSAAQVRGDRIVAAVVVGVFTGMLGLTFASAELYDLFCRATGYNGMTRVAGAAPKSISDRTVKVRFDANVAPGLPWRFEAEKAEIELKLGETAEVYYTIRNVSGRDAAGIASYNVQPEIAGSFFNKIQCFCFTEQTLKAGEARQEPVVFFVDPAMLADVDAQRVRTITLSYTFNPVKAPVKPLAAVGTGTKLE